MGSAEGLTLKRTFDQSEMEDGQEPDGTRCGEGRKLVHHMKYEEVDTGMDVDIKARAASLESLPIEILIQIASYLSTSELLPLRLTSRAIEIALFNDFAAYYFAKKQFMLTVESLQCLVDISRHPKLSTVLEHVIISLDKYQLDVSWSHFAADDDTGTKLSRATKYRQGLYDQTALLTSGMDRELLTQAFLGLKNLKTVGLRDYNNGQRWRDGEGSEWRAHGANTVFRETGMKLLASGLRYDSSATPQYAGAGTAIAFAGKTFMTVLHALGSAGSTPASIEILLRDQANGLPDYAFYIPKYLEPAVTPLLAGLKTLLLTVDLTRQAVSNHATLQLYLPDYSLQAFLTHVPNITHLRLNFQNSHDLAKGGMRFLEWLASTDPDSDTPPLSKLTQLDLGMLRGGGALEMELVQRLVTRFGRTLRGLSFWKVGLVDSAAQEAALRLNKSLRPNRWAELLVQLPNLAPGLEHISVGCLMQLCNTQLHSVLLKVAHKGPQRPPMIREYRREEMRDLKRFKAMLEQELIVPWHNWGSLDLPVAEDEDSESHDSDQDQNDDDSEEEEE